LNDSVGPHLAKNIFLLKNFSALSRHVCLRPCAWVPIPSSPIPTCPVGSFAFLRGQRSFRQRRISLWLKAR